MFGSSLYGLFHNVTNRSPEPAKISKMIMSQLPIQLADPEQWVPVPASWLLALVFFSTHSLVPTTETHQCSRMRNRGRSRWLAHTAHTLKMCGLPQAAGCRFRMWPWGRTTRAAENGKELSCSPKKGPDLSKTRKNAPVLKQLTKEQLLTRT